MTRLERRHKILLSLHQSDLASQLEIMILWSIYKRDKYLLDEGCLQVCGKTGCWASSYCADCPSGAAQICLEKTSAGGCNENSYQERLAH